MRLRRKLVRRSGGRASHVSMSASRMCSNCCLRLGGFGFFGRFGFGVRALQCYQDSESLRASSGSPTVTAVAGNICAAG